QGAELKGIFGGGVKTSGGFDNALSSAVFGQRLNTMAANSQFDVNTHSSTGGGGNSEHRNLFDFRIKWGLFGGVHVGVKGLAEVEVGANFGSEEWSAVTHQRSISESYDVSAKVGRINIGLDMSREAEGWPHGPRYAMFGRVEEEPGLSMSEMFEDKRFEFAPVFGMSRASAEFGRDLVITVGGGVFFGAELRLDVSEGFRRLSGAYQTAPYLMVGATY
ncbi:MAG: hypothetical protein ACRDHZ_25915, partial [Ktedonobacteraceae bacterium]